MTWADLQIFTGKHHIERVLTTTLKFNASGMKW